MTPDDEAKQLESLVIQILCNALLNDKESLARQAAAESLGRMRTSSSAVINALMRTAIDDPSLAVRICAYRALGEIYNSTYLQDQLNQIVKAMSDQTKVQMNFNAPVTSATGNVEGDLFINVQEQDLAEAAAQIQALLYQLSQTYANESDRQVEAVKREVKRNPTFRQRLWNAAKSGGVEAVKQLLDYVFKNPVAAVVAESVKAFVEAEASP